jgi:hypothetical protein
MTATLQLQQIILERTSELEKYALKPNASEFYLNRENDLLEQLSQISDGLGNSLVHLALWQEVEEAWNTYQNLDVDFSGFTLEIKVKSGGTLYLLPFNLSEHGI